MSDLAIGYWSFPVLLLLIFLRLPIGLSMLMVGILGNYLIRGNWMPILAQFKDMPYSSFASYSLSIVPLFLLMGLFATSGGMSKALFKSAETWMGHFKGGVAIATIGACAGFGAICGSSLATAATMGQVALPELKRNGYSSALSTGAVAAGGTLGILIPPSVILVVYAIVAEQNIAKLFVAAFVPGILAAVGYMIAINVYVRLVPDSATSRPKASLRERFQSLLAVWPVMLIFAAVVGGIYLGVFTPTEAAAVGAVATGLLSYLNGGLNFAGLKSAIFSTASATGMIFFIVLGAAVYNSFLAISLLPQELASQIVSLGLNPWWVLTGILLFYLVMGCFMDSLSMVLLTIPIFFPMVSSLDFGVPPAEFGLWFGVLVLIVVEVGLITPPVGMNLFIINAMDVLTPIRETYRGVLPFVVSDIVRTVLLAAFPVLSLFAVRALF